MSELHLDDRTVNETTDAVKINECLYKIARLQESIQLFVFDLETQKALSRKLDEARVHLESIREVRKSEETKESFDPEIPSDAITQREAIGNGGYGVVFKGLHFGSRVALKTPKGPSEKERIILRHEMKIMKQVSHPNLARFIGTTYVTMKNENGDTSQCLAIVSELCDTDLSKACREERENNPDFQTKAVGWLCEAARGIAWLHIRCHMVHLDIKPANILLKNGHAVVTDFGSTKVVDAADGMLKGETVRVTRSFAAPEILRHQPFSYPVDVYAFGMTMCEIVSGRVSEYKNDYSKEKFDGDVCNGVRPVVSDLPEKGVNRSLIELIQACWDGDPQKRPNMPDICKQLKEIFVETVVPKTNPAYGFWLQHFGDKLVDEVCVSELLNRLPNKENKDFVDAYKWILKGRLNPRTVTLRHLANTCEWYGDWLHNGTAVSIKTDLSEHKWFLGFVSRETARLRGIEFMKMYRRPWFIVRCSETNPSHAPFTVDVFTKTKIWCHRVEKAHGWPGVLKQMNQPAQPVFGKGLLVVAQKFAALHPDGAHPDGEVIDYSHLPTSYDPSTPSVFPSSSLTDCK